MTTSSIATGGVSRTTSQMRFQVASQDQQIAAPATRDVEVREKFQDFVAGTFYKTMLKALRQGQQKPAFMHGGQAEDIFQQHMDQQFAEQLASSHGNAFADNLFQQYAQRLDVSV